MMVVRSCPNKLSKVGEMVIQRACMFANGGNGGAVRVDDMHDP